ncbi:MAG: hypothetical protein R3F03_03085 [Opitutaceae bacterium]
MPDDTEVDFDPDRVAQLSAYPGTFEWDIVGESYYQAALERIVGGKTPEGHCFESKALLVPYVSKYDEDAVAVLMGESELVGHLPRHFALKFRSILQNIGLGGCSLLVPCKVVGGWKRGAGDEGYFGVKLDLPG